MLLKLCTREKALKNIHSNIHYITKVLQSGIRSYLADKVNNKYGTFSPEDIQTMVSIYRTLTPREREVFYLRAQGFSIKEISEKLFISPKTVDNHCTNLMRKLNIHSSFDIVRIAVRLGLINISR